MLEEEERGTQNGTDRLGEERKEKRFLNVYTCLWEKTTSQRKIILLLTKTIKYHESILSTNIRKQ